MLIIVPTVLFFNTRVFRGFPLSNELTGVIQNNVLDALRQAK